MSGPMNAALQQRLADFEEDPEVRVIVMTGQERALRGW